MPPLIFINTHPIQYFAPLYRYLSANGFDVQVWYCSGKSLSGGLDQEFNTKIVWDIPLLEGYNSRFFQNRYDQYSGFKFGKYANPDLIDALRAEPPSLVVVTAWNYYTAVQVLLKARKFGHTIFFRGETNLDHELQKPLWKRSLRKLLLPVLLKSVSAFLYIGDESKAFYQHLGIPETRLFYTPYAVDNERFQQAAAQMSQQEARKILGLPVDDKIVLFSGKFIEKKRPMDLLIAFEAFKSNAILVMMGEGPLRPQMEAFIAEKQLLGKVLLTGFINQQAVPNYYRSANVLVMCSDVGETWGLSVNEAMNFSLPVILSSRCGCNKNLVLQGSNGFVFRTGDVLALQHLIAATLTASDDKMKKMGDKSVEIINRHSFVEIAKGLKQAIRLAGSSS